MEDGRNVGVLARRLFPKGVLVHEVDFDRARRRTVELLARNTEIVFEAAFEWDQVRVRIDVLHQINGASYQIIEVKNASYVKPEHKLDVAVQRAVLERCGVRIDACSLMYLDTSCRGAKLSDLFTTEDIDVADCDLYQNFSSYVSQHVQVIDRDHPPQIPRGEYCRRPRKCKFRSECWPTGTDVSISNIPRLSAAKEAEFTNTGIYSVSGICDRKNLSQSQLEYVDLSARGETVIRDRELKAFLAELAYPLHFLDFETESIPVPRLNDTRPFQQIPFQYSVHRLDAQGRLVHQEYLHPDAGDPRKALAVRLVQDIGRKGSVVAWNMGVEARAMKQLSAVVPALKDRLDGIVSRLWDQAKIFPTVYFDPRFRGKASIKNVLPVLVPALSYDGLSVRDGTQAGVTWARYRGLPDGNERNQLRAQLLAYCELDTLAMVEIHKMLESVVT